MILRNITTPSANWKETSYYKSIINTQIRQGVDSVYGYGGNEFAIILIETIPDITEVTRKRIKTSVQEAYNPGVSVGYAQFSPGLSPEEFVKEADDRLGAAKAGKTEKK